MLRARRYWTMIRLLSGMLIGLTSHTATGESVRDCDTCPEMVTLPAGKFLMGSPEDERDRSKDESPQHIVTFSQPFAIGRYEITHEEFDAFVKASGRTMDSCFYEPGFPQAGKHPAVCMTWDDANAYVAWLSTQTSRTYRLPTEAEWEYAARAQNKPGEYKTFSFGNDPKIICDFANSAETICDDGYSETSPVGSHNPNDFGIYDMHGNVWEMTEDCLTADYSSAPDDGSKVSLGDCTKMIIRGGGWVNRSGHLRSANRGWIGRNLRDVLTGLRVVRVGQP